MKPERVVEAREHQPRVEDEAAMGDQRRIEQGEVGGIGQHALVQGKIVAEPPGGPDPDLLGGGAVLGRKVAGEVDRPDLDRPLMLPIGLDLGRQPVDAGRAFSSASLGSASGGGTSGILIWWCRPPSSLWKEAAIEKIAWPC